jgi:hypothetical protein
MFNRFLIIFLITFLVFFLVSLHNSLGKNCAPCAACGGSGKRSESIRCSLYPGFCAPGVPGYNCIVYYDPAFPIFEYESSATKYFIQNFMPAILLSFFLTFFFIALIPKNRLFILKIFSKIFRIKPQIIQTKCKYYNSYWFRKFKKYL